jgi:uncharacterized protein (DUF2236 family)
MMPAEPPVSARINAERVVLLAWTRAILMQFAHPLVAAGVDAHSTFRERSWSPLNRLHHTVRAMLALTFGTDAERDRAIEGIRTIHRRVHGSLQVATGCHPAGTPYSAEDPALVLWVHATLLESVPLVYDLLVAPLTIAERDDYCAQAAPVAIALGAAERDVPRTWSSTLACLEEGYASREVAVGDQARRLAAAVLSPPFAPLVFPAAWINRLLTIGLLPPHLRDEYGYTWRPRDQRAFDAIAAQIRRVRRIAPDRIALWPEARRVIHPLA